MIVTPITKYDATGKSLHLSVGKEYEVLAIEGDCYRVLTDAESLSYGNDPVLYESSYFRVIDDSEPAFWVNQYFDGEKYSNPFVWALYFFEDYHDGSESAREKFMEHLRKYYPRT